MSEGTTTQGTESGCTDDAHVRTREAMEETLNREIDPGYFVFALIAAGIWWQTIGAFSASIAALGFVVLSAAAGPLVAMATTKRWATAGAVVLESAVLTRGRPWTAPASRSRRSPPRAATSRSSAIGTRPTGLPTRTPGSRRSTIRSAAGDGPSRSSTAIRRTSGWTSAITHDPTRSYLRSWTPTSLNVWIPISLFFLAIAGLIALDFNSNFDVAAPLVVLLFGAPFALVGLYGVLRGARTYRWPSTTGDIEGAGVSRATGGAGDSRSDPGYNVDLRYEYEVDGSTYTSTRYATGGKTPRESTLSAAKALQKEQYPVGGETTVYYNPRKPDVSVLERGGVGRSLVGALIGLAFCGLGVYVLVQPDPAVPPVAQEWVDRILGRIQ